MFTKLLSFLCECVLLAIRAEQNRSKPISPDKPTEPFSPETEPTSIGSVVGFTKYHISVSGRDRDKTDISPN